MYMVCTRTELKKRDYDSRCHAIGQNMSRILVCIDESSSSLSDKTHPICDYYVITYSCIDFKIFQFD
jgi:hypothetical protein